ncbi:MAG: PrsW family intramembrane metalloprotease [Myxococcota bacterium]|nr:PrsW family intramembrane metalloprotease [Myxococcota bacterium]
MSQDTTQQRFRRKDNLLLRIGCLLFVGVFFLLGLTCSGLFGLSMLFSQPGFFIIATILATLTAVPYGLLLLWLDRNEPEPATLLITAFLWGACVSTMISGEVNSGVANLAFNLTGDPFIADFMAASFSAPFIEEITKGFAVLLLFTLFHKEFDNVLDGIIYGAIIGLGFAWFENITYYLNAAAEGGMGGMLQNAWARGVVSASGGSHAAYTGLTGMGFGLMRVMRRGPIRWAMPPIFLGIAMFAHFAWNTFVGPFVYITGGDSVAVQYLVALPLAVAILQLPFTLVLLIVVGVAWRHENRIIRQYLSDSAADIVKPGDIERLLPARRRAWASLKRFFTKGPGPWWLHRRLGRRQIDLAFLKWHHEKDEVAWDPDQDVDILKIREDIRKVRAQLRSSL